MIKLMSTNFFIKKKTLFLNKFNTLIMDLNNDLKLNLLHSVFQKYLLDMP